MNRRRFIQTIAAAVVTAPALRGFLPATPKVERLRCLGFVAWCLFNDDRIEFPLGPEAGPNPDDPEGSFNDLELEIDAYSMQRVRLA